MLARVCAAQMARTIVRALHVSQPGPIEVPKKQVDRKKTKGRKKKSAAGGC